MASIRTAETVPSTGRISMPWLRHISPAAAAMGAIMLVALALSIFIYSVVVEGFKRYSETTVAIRVNRDILELMLDQDTAFDGYENTHQATFLTDFRKITPRVLRRLDLLERYTIALALPQAYLYADRLHESYVGWTVNVQAIVVRGPRYEETDKDQEHMRGLMNATRTDMESIRKIFQANQDETIAGVKQAVVAGSAFMLVAVALIGTIGILGERKQRTELAKMNAALDRQNAELERSNKALSDFAYVASHDLQEPLRTVSSYTQLLERRYGEKLGAEGAEFIAFAADAAKRMERLIADLLAYSRVGAEATKIERVSSLAEFETARSNLEARIHELGATIEVGPLPPVSMTPGHLAMIFQNLLGNALKYHGPQTPRVQVTARRQGGEWIFAVSDNGIGIAQQHQERIFKMFQRLHGRGEYEGTGIGLALVKRIVELHGGRIWVESEEGKGSTFAFTVAAVD